MTWRGALTRRAARAYVCGPTADDAVRYGAALQAKGIACAIGLLDARPSDQEAVARAYRRAVDALGELRLDAYVSLKAPALGFDRRLLEVLARAAAGARVPLHFDSLGPETAAPTFEAVAELRARHDDLGVTLPGRWRRSRSDAARTRELGLRVRVVKGHWRDPEPDGRDDRAAFMAVVETLAGHDRPVAVATHDVELARIALARLRASGTPCSLELLYGLPHAALGELARAGGWPLRVYVSFGRGLVPYSVRERGPRALGWLLHDVALPRRRGRALVA